MYRPGVLARDDIKTHFYQDCQWCTCTVYVWPDSSPVWSAVRHLNLNCLQIIVVTTLSVVSLSLSLSVGYWQCRSGHLQAVQLQCKFFLSRLECGWVHAGRGVTGPLLGHHGDSHSFVCSLLISTVGVRRSNQVQQSNIQHKVLIKPDGCGLQCIVRPVRVVQVHPHMLCVFYQTNLTLKLTAVRSVRWVLPTAWEVRLINVLTWLTQSAGLLCSDFLYFFLSCNAVCLLRLSAGQSSPVCVFYWRTSWPASSPLTSRGWGHSQGGLPLAGPGVGTGLSLVVIITHQPVRGGDNFCVNSLGETAERGERTKKRMADWWDDWQLQLYTRHHHHHQLYHGDQHQVLSWGPRSVPVLSYFCPAQGQSSQAGRLGHRQWADLQWVLQCCTPHCCLSAAAALWPAARQHTTPPSSLTSTVLPLPWQPLMWGHLLADGDIRLEHRQGECITANIGTCLSVEISRIFPDFRLYSKQWKLHKHLHLSPSFLSLIKSEYGVLKHFKNPFPPKLTRYKYTIQLQEW